MVVPCENESTTENFEKNCTKGDLLKNKEID